MRIFLEQIDRTILRSDITVDQRQQSIPDSPSSQPIFVVRPLIVREEMLDQKNISRLLSQDPYTVAITDYRKSFLALRIYRSLPQYLEIATYARGRIRNAPFKSLDLVGPKWIRRSELHGVAH